MLYSVMAMKTDFIQTELPRRATVSYDLHRHDITTSQYGTPVNSIARYIDLALLKRFKVYVQASRLSQALIAERIGISATTLAQYIARQYQGNAAELEKKVRRYLKYTSITQGNRMHVPLSITARIIDALNAIHKRAFLGLVVGPAGIGKSYALYQYCCYHPQSHVVAIDPSFSKAQLIRTTADTLHIPFNTNSAGITRRLIAALYGTNTLICYDEADSLSNASLEWIRRVIHDKARCGVVLCGLNRLERRIRTHTGNCDQLRSRVDVLCTLNQVETSDITMLWRSVWNDLDRNAQQCLEQHAQNSIRRTIKLIENTNQALKRTGRKSPSAQDVEGAAALLM